MISIHQLATNIYQSINEEFYSCKELVSTNPHFTNCLLHIIRKKIWHHRKEIFDEKIIEYFNDTPKKVNFIYFRAGSGKQDAQVYGIQLINYHSGEQLRKLITKIADPDIKNAILFIAVIAKNKYSVKNYLEKVFPGIATESFSSRFSENSELFLSFFKINPDLLTKPDADLDFHDALEAAVKNMRYENMLSILKHIINLRTHLPEEKMDEMLSLNTIFKMAFSMEQGVNIDDVYDPEAFRGYTDTQLAAKNLVADIQKTFSINLSHQELTQINTLKDLAATLTLKTSA